MSPFISVSRRHRRRPSPTALFVAVAASLLFAALAAPAFGGPSVLSIAQRALKLATKANKPVGSRRLSDGAVTNKKLANRAVTAVKLAPGAIDSTNIGNSAVTGVKIAAGAVGNANIAAGAIGSANIANGAVGGIKIASGSVTLSHLAGTDHTGMYNIPSVLPRTCITEVVAVPGAQVGQFPLLAFTGDLALPRDLLLEPIKVTAADSVRLKICNPTDGATLAATGTEIRIITLS
jgi:hypothetical protein